MHNQYSTVSRTRFQFAFSVCACATAAVRSVSVSECKCAFGSNFVCEQVNDSEYDKILTPIESFDCRGHARIQRATYS